VHYFEVTPRTIKITDAIKYCIQSKKATTRIAKSESHGVRCFGWSLIPTNSRNRNRIFIRLRKSCWIIFISHSYVRRLIHACWIVLKRVLKESFCQLWMHGLVLQMCRSFVHVVL